MVAGNCRRGSSRNDCQKCGKRTGKKDYVHCGQCESWLNLSCTSLPREISPFLPVSENLPFKYDNCLNCDLKAETLEEVKENRMSVISDILTQELSKIPQVSPVQ